MVPSTRTQRGIGYVDPLHARARALSGSSKYSRWDWVPVASLYFTSLTFSPFFCVSLYAVAVADRGGITIFRRHFLEHKQHSSQLHSQPLFRVEYANTAFSYLLSITIGFSQELYNFVHMRHHSGNMDRPDEHGKVIDYLSIYKHGHDGQPENVWKYTFLSFFRDDPKEMIARMGRSVPTRLGRLSGSSPRWCCSIFV